MPFLNSFARRGLGVLILVHLFSCSPQPEFQYSDGLLSYLEQLGLSREKDKHVMLVHPQACNSCLASVIHTLENSANPLNIIIIGKADALQKIGYSTGPLSNHSVLFDGSLSIYQYRTGAENLSYFHIANGKVKSYMHVTESNKNDFKKLIQGL
jgi:hypothetical protein